MTKLIKIRWRSLLLVLLALMGVAFLAIGWSGIPQKILGTDKEAAPAASLVTEMNEETDPQQNNDQSSSASTNVIKMPEQEAAENDGGANYFVDSRLGRQHARGQELETLRAIINNPSSDQEIRSEAQQAIMAISKNISMEIELENLIRAKGFDDAVVYLKNDSANVVISSGALTPEEAARVCDLVARGTGISEQNIVIIPTQ